jgi:membrane fusion protein (multidrug efflux system)
MATMVDEVTEQHSEEKPDAPERPPEAPSKRKFVVPIIAIVVLVALGFGIKAFLYSRVHESTDDAQVDGHIIPVLAKVGGYVSSVRVQDNDSIHAGDTLATIDDDEYKVKVAQADANLAAARYTVGSGSAPGQARAAVVSATSNYAAQDAQIIAARAQEQQAQSDLIRMKSLAAKQIVSSQQLDAAQSAADAAAATLQAVQRQAAAGNAGVTSAQAGVRVAQARTEAAQAALDDARLQLSYTVITAPVSGTISKKLIELGQLLQPGQTLMSVVADTGAYITANFKETQLTNMRVGQPVEIDVDAYPGCTAEGKVQSLSAATGARFALLPPDNATGNFTKVVQRVPVRVLVTRGCGPDRPLRQGLSVVAHVKTG